MSAAVAQSAPLELSQTDLGVYQRVGDSPFCFAEPASGVLRLSGETRLDFLQRQSTNDLRLLSPSQALVTVLTSPAARILDVLLLIDQGDSILLLPLPGRLSATAQFLRSRIFFMDRVTVDVCSPDWACIEVGGRGSREILETIGFALPDAPGAAACLDTPAGRTWAVRVAGRFPGDVLFVASRGALPALKNALRGGGAVELTPAVHEVLRIENGIPGPSVELTEDYTPLEAGLLDAIAQAKGCYTGQEVIARQLTYDKVVQRLVGLRSDAPVSAGDRVFVEGRRVGVVTSVARSPSQGLIALGYVRRPECEVGRVLSLAPGVGSGQVTVVSLPYSGEK